MPVQQACQLTVLPTALQLAYSQSGTALPHWRSAVKKSTSHTTIGSLACRRSSYACRIASAVRLRLMYCSRMGMVKSENSNPDRRTAGWRQGLPAAAAKQTATSSLLPAQCFQSSSGTRPRLQELVQRGVEVARLAALTEAHACGHSQTLQSTLTKWVGCTRLIGHPSQAGRCSWPGRGHGKPTSITHTGCAVPALHTYQ